MNNMLFAVHCSKMSKIALLIYSVIDEIQYSRFVTMSRHFPVQIGFSTIFVPP